jgi:hypothetical protein
VQAINAMDETRSVRIGGASMGVGRAAPTLAKHRAGCQRRLRHQIKHLVKAEKMPFKALVSKWVIAR